MCPSSLLFLGVAALLVSVSSVSDNEWRTTFNELSQCTFWTGYCQSKTGELPRLLLSRQTPRTCQSSGGVWRQRFASWDALKRDSDSIMKNDKDTYLFLARVPATHTLNNAEAIIRCGEVTYGKFLGVDSVPAEATWAFAVPANFKLSPGAHGALEATKATKSVDSSLAFHVTTVKGNQKELLGQSWAKKVVEDGALEVTSGGFRLANIKDVDSLQHSLNHLTLSKDVVEVDFEFKYKVLNDGASQLTQSDTADRVIWDHGLHGEAQFVHVIDDGLDMEHCHFRDPAVTVTFSGKAYTDPSARKVVGYYGHADSIQGETAGHGTHVAGSVFGYPVTPGALQEWGMAYAAKGVFYDIGVNGDQFLTTPSNLDVNMFPFGRNLGARIHTNSWGGSPDVYTSGSKDVDEYTFANQENIILFAAGNAGDDIGAHSIGSPGTAKNSLTVGASAKAYSNGYCPSRGVDKCSENLAEFSSFGPRFDGAIKPEIVAPGQVIYSANSAASGQSCQFTGLQGTSMATPVTAGNVALVRQYFEEGWYPTGAQVNANGFEPMGALLKAMIINSGRYLTGNHTNHGLESYPAFYQGFGAVHLNQTLYFADTSRHNLYVLGDLSDMPSFSSASDAPLKVHLKVTAGEAPWIKATLVWHDYHAETSASTLLVNDLDLQLDCVGGCEQTKYPNARDFPDRVNNAEQIEWHNLSAGDCMLLTVSPHVIASAPQPYSLVISGNFEVKQAGEECYVCEAGKYLSVGNPTCQTCPSGSTSKMGADSLADCFCENGKYGTITSTDSNQCQDCPQYSTSENGSARTEGECQCQPGFKGTSPTDCTPCTNGVDFTDSMGEASCRPCTASCPSGTTQQPCYANQDSSCGIEGQVRLTSGGSDYGRIEVAHNGEWGTVCGDVATHDTGDVVCQMLGSSGAESVLRNSYYSTNDNFYTDPFTPIWMSDIFCDSSHSTIAECPFNGWGSNNCSHSSDLSVVCQCPNAGEIHDCNGVCRPDTRGDSNCDSHFNCAFQFYDELDCLASTVQATELTCGASVSGSTSGAGSFPNTHSSGDHIYKMTFTESKILTVDSCDSGMSDTVLYLFHENQFVVGNDDHSPCGLRSQITTQVYPGTYYVMIEGYGTEQGAYTVDAECVTIGASTNPTPSPTPSPLPDEILPTCGGDNLISMEFFADFDPTGAMRDHIQQSQSNRLLYKTC